MSKWIMALDQGTTSSRCLIFDRNGRIRSSAQKEVTQIYPQEGWVEHDPMEIWATQAGVASEAMTKIGVEYQDIAAIGITNQRETTVIWDKETGEPIHHAIVWQCRRTAGICSELKEAGYERCVREKTGLPIDAYFSATKIKWILDHVQGARERAEAGKLLFGTVDTWLIWRLTKGKLHITDYSNASRTMLLNIHTLDWDDELLAMLDIPRCMLPQVRASSEIYGYTDPSVFGGKAAIAGIAGDQQAALFGQGCHQESSAKNTYGTGCFLLMNTGSKPVLSQSGLLTTIAWGMNGQITYALEGSVFVAGAAIQWLRDELKLIDSAANSAEMARIAGDNGGVYLAPAFTGLGAPYWDPYARGVLIGMTRGTNRFHIVRAALEAIAYQTKDVLSAMQEDSGMSLKTLQVDGGASANDFLMQFQADILGIDVRRPDNVESTALGAACLAGLASGFWPGRQAMQEAIHMQYAERVFTPTMPPNQAEALLSDWHKALRRSMHWTL